MKSNRRIYWDTTCWLAWLDDERHWPTPVVPRRVSNSLPLSTCHTFAIRSKLAVASRFPSGLKATPLTGAEWPRKVINSFPLSASQTFAVWSTLAVARYLPSGLKTTLREKAEQRGLGLLRRKYLHSRNYFHGSSMMGSLQLIYLGLELGPLRSGNSRENRLDR